MMKISEDSLLNITQSSKVEAINLLNLLLLLNQAILSLSKIILKIRIIRTVRTEVVHPHNMPQTNSLTPMRDSTKADLRTQMRESEFKREQLNKQEDQTMR
nr:MAG TPA: hypothetical protein [Caudoviricetes sp.]